MKDHSFPAFSLPAKGLYLDYNSTTPPAPFLDWKELIGVWGNPSSRHREGQRAKAKFGEARKNIARFLGASPLELVATSGGTEANNLFLKGVFEESFPKNPERNEIICSAVEHSSVMAPLKQLQAKGAKIIKIPVSVEGALDMEAYKRALSKKTLMVTCMWVNNITGGIYPIPKMAKLAHSVGALFHTDAIQALGKMSVHLQKSHVDGASFSAHKFYALKGGGVMYCRQGVGLDPLITGGPHERKRRAGTENVLAMLSFGEVARYGDKILEEHEDIKNLKEFMELELLKHIPKSRVIGAKHPRVSNTTCLFIPDIIGESLLMNMDLKGYAFSVGSACHSGVTNPSETLLAMGLKEEQARSVVRLSLGLGVKKTKLRQFIREFAASVRHLLKLST